MRATRLIFVLVLIAAAGGLGWYFLGDRIRLFFPGQQAEQQAVQPQPQRRMGRRGGGLASPDTPVPVVAGTVEQRDVPLYLSGLGTVQAFRTVTVASRIEGQLQKLNFDEGQDVKAGDVLAQIDPRSLEAALRQMEANLRRDQAQLASARADLERYGNLRKEGNYVTQQQLDTTRALVGQLEAATEADKAQIDSARVQLDYATIRSPINGRTGLRLVDEGNMIRAGDQTGIVVVTQLQPISLVFTLPEENLQAVNGQLSAGTALTVEAFSRDGETKLAEGKLATIDNQIDQKTGTFKLKATFANENRVLWPGQFVNARLRVMTRRGGTVVAEAAVQRGPEGTYVFVIKPDQTVEMRPVTVGTTQNGLSLIDKGLTPGERVVVDGQYKLQPGGKIVEAPPIIHDGAPPGRPERPGGGGNGAGAARPAAS
jgi:multidrug efflux system membrane fusion protein